MKISEGLKEQGIVVGNNFDKYASTNPIVVWMMKGFHKSLRDLVTKVAPTTVHEIGCGEGYWTIECNSDTISARGSDFSTQIVNIAKENAVSAGMPREIFQVKSIYELDPEEDCADLIVCCEVLEHLENPDAGLRSLQNVVTKDLILSVPREPIWCALNIARGKYLSRWGNTPGHVQHWSKSGFVELVSEYFEVVEVRSPFPWTMLSCKPLA